MTPQEVAELLQREGKKYQPQVEDEALEQREVVQRRTELLTPVLRYCESIKETAPGELELIVEQLANGSRNVAWRKPLGDSGVLGFALENLTATTRSQGLKVQSLRIIGNSCADTDENRARIVQGKHFPTLISLLQVDALVPYAIPVLYNVLVDYEPAQAAASQALLSQALIARISSPSISNFYSIITYFCKIFELLLTQDNETSVAGPATVRVLLDLALVDSIADDADEFVPIASVACSYLANESFLNNILDDNGVQKFFEVLQHAHLSFDTADIDNPETIEQLKNLQLSLLKILAELTIVGGYAEKYPLGSSVSDSLITWLKSSNPLMAASACLALGNLTRSDEVAVPLIQTYKVHELLFHTLSNRDVTDSQLLHSALGFLKNLALPKPNKPHMKNLLQRDCVPRIYGNDASPQVQFAAISLARLLLLDCPSNLAEICLPVVEGSEGGDQERSDISEILSLFARSDAEPTKLEASRIVLNACRVLHTQPVLPTLSPWIPAELNTRRPDLNESNLDKSDAEAIRANFYSKHTSIPKALSHLVTQQKWPALRSETWFVLALMCLSKDGTSVVVETLQGPGAYAQLAETITGRAAPISQVHNAEVREIADSDVDAAEVASMVNSLGLNPQPAAPATQPGAVIRADRENALVMCTELLKGWSDDMGELRLNALRDLVKEGTEIVAGEKAGEEKKPTA